MAILVNPSTSRDPRVSIISSKCNMDGMQMQFHRTDPEPNKPFEHEVKARQRREMAQHIVGTIILGIVIFGLPMLGKAFG